MVDLSLNLSHTHTDICAFRAQAISRELDRAGLTANDEILISWEMSVLNNSLEPCGYERTRGALPVLSHWGRLLTFT